MITEAEMSRLNALVNEKLADVPHYADPAPVIEEIAPGWDWIDVSQIGDSQRHRVLLTVYRGP